MRLEGIYNSTQGLKVSLAGDAKFLLSNHLEREKSVFNPFPLSSQLKFTSQIHLVVLHPLADCHIYIHA